MNGEDLRLKLKEAVEAHDETVKAAKEHELEHERLVGNLVSEAERINEIILGKKHVTLFLYLISGLSCSDLAGLIYRLLPRGGRPSPEGHCFRTYAAGDLWCCR